MKDAATTDIVKIYQKADADTQGAMTKSMVSLVCLLLFLMPQYILSNSSLFASRM